MTPPIRPTLARYICAQLCVERLGATSQSLEHFREAAVNKNTEVILQLVRVCLCNDVSPEIGKFREKLSASQ